MANHQPLFSLVPMNERAHEVVRLERNRDWRVKDREDKLVLCIGHLISRSGNATTLVTLGRDERNDIFVDSAQVANLQCSFEFNPDTYFVMFYDRSRAMTSKIHGRMCHPFQQGRPRKVLVHPGFNEFIGFGGENADSIQFRLRWHRDPVRTPRRAVLRNITVPQNPNLADTIVNLNSELASPRVTQVRSIEPERSLIRWLNLGCLGSGSYGEVFQAINADDGNLMAVKIMRQRGNSQEREMWKARWMREVKILSEARHLHIVEYIGAQGWDGEKVSIFMGLKEGTLTSFVERELPLPRLGLSDIVFNHMLQAIDFLATRNIVHRDIKPDNILYVRQTDRYLFQLGDFGLSTRVVAEANPQGTPIYIAPELLQRGEVTHKADVWSLFITMIWISGNQQFRSLGDGYGKSLERTLEILSECTLSEPEYFERFRGMERINPQGRPSAAQLLLRYYGGEGLTTPRDQIPPLNL